MTYEFTISGGKVTAMWEVGPYGLVPAPMPPGVTFQVGAGSVTASESDQISAQSFVFTQEPHGSAFYDLTTHVQHFLHPATSVTGGVFGYDIGVSAGHVTGIEIQSNLYGHASIQPLAITPATEFGVSGGVVTETQVQGGEVQVTSFVQPAGSSLYAIASQTTDYVPTDGSWTALDVIPTEEDRFTFTGSAISQIQQVEANGSLTTITPNAGLHFAPLAAGYVEETAWVNGYPEYAVYYDPSGSGAGTYTQIAHGFGSTVDLAGLEAQIAALHGYAGSLI